MRRVTAIVICLITLLFLSGCDKPCIEGHTWIYSVSNRRKTCSVCGIEEPYLPSGNYISSEMLAVGQWFNENQIACAYSEAVFEDFNQNRSEEKAKQLIEDGELFYIAPGETCDFVDKRKLTSPQSHIVITSGEMNGTECWTLTYAIASQEILDEFYASIRLEEELNSKKADKEVPLDYSNQNSVCAVVKEAEQMALDIGNSINNDGTLDYDKHCKLHEIYELIIPYIGNEECDQFLMSNEMLTNNIIGMDNWGYFEADSGENVVFIAKKSLLDGEGTMSLNVAVQTENLNYSGTYYSISDKGTISDTSGNIAGSIKFITPDIINFSTKDGSTYTMSRVSKYSKEQMDNDVNYALSSARNILETTGDPINPDDTMDMAAYKTLSKAFELLYPYRGIEDCANLLMSDKLYLCCLTSSGIDIVGRFESDDGLQYAEFYPMVSGPSHMSISTTVVLSEDNSIVVEEAYCIDSNCSLYYTTVDISWTNYTKEVIATVKFLDVDTITVTMNGESSTLHRAIKYGVETETNTTTTDSNNSKEYVGFFEGTYLVGTDIPAGTYRLVSLYPEYSAYWERTSNASGETSAIIANDNFSGTTYVTVKNGEYFTVKRCSAALQ
mgnify:CR=1 FL=1